MRTGIITLLAVLSVSCSENSIPDVKTNYIDLGLSVNWSPDNVQTADKASSIPSLADAQELIDNCYFIKEDDGVRCISKLNRNSVFFPVNSKCMSYSIDGFIDENSHSDLCSRDFLNHVEQNSVSIKDYLSDAVVFNNRIYSGDRLIDDPVKARSATSLVALDKRYDIFPLTVGYCDVLFFDKDKRFIKTVESYISEPVKKHFPKMHIISLSIIIGTQ